MAINHLPTWPSNTMGIKCRPLQCSRLPIEPEGECLSALQCLTRRFTLLALCLCTLIQTQACKSLSTIPILSQQAGANLQEWMVGLIIWAARSQDSSNHPLHISCTHPSLRLPMRRALLGRGELINALSCASLHALV